MICCMLKISAPNRVTSPPNRVTSPPNRVTYAPNRVTYAPNRATGISLTNIVFLLFSGFCLHKVSRQAISGTSGLFCILGLLLGSVFPWRRRTPSLSRSLSRFPSTALQKRLSSSRNSCSKIWCRMSDTSAAKCCVHRGPAELKYKHRVCCKYRCNPELRNRASGDTP